MSKLVVNIEYIDHPYGGYSKMTVVHNGKVIIEEEDGGEPEDQTFGRDLNWIKPAILKAYKLGLSDGQFDQTEK